MTHPQDGRGKFVKSITKKRYKMGMIKRRYDDDFVRSIEGLTAELIKELSAQPLKLNAPSK